MHQAKATPNAAENATSPMLKETGEAELGAVEEDGEVEEDREAEENREAKEEDGEAEEEDREAGEELSLVGETEGSPYPVTLPKNGPGLGREVATAPTLDKAPTFYWCLPRY